jgi:hypothetical protein
MVGALDQQPVPDPPGNRAEFPSQIGHNQSLRSVTPARHLPQRITRGMENMATDYDTPRKTDEEINEDSLQELQARRADKAASAVDVDENEQAENFELPGADLSNEELSVRVLPRQADEFTCSRCFLVHHRSQLAKEQNGLLICRECAA